MWTPPEPISLDEPTLRELERLLEDPTTPDRTVQRIRIVLAASYGLSNREIARRTGADRGAVIEWRRRFREDGIPGLLGSAPGKPKEPLDPRLVHTIAQLA